ncbi:MAG TPA: quinone-dependent dihydroorotate dehydrogenase, partial [Pyrinomonadaceae bacterium]
MSKIYEKLIRRLLFHFSPETAHEIGIEILKSGLSLNFIRNFAAERFSTESFGELERFGLKFKNPLGIAAGFDKNGVVVNQLAALGFGFVEVGTVTFEPQKGNEKPRLFRLPEDEALINRLGFNNEGTRKV